LTTCLVIDAAPACSTASAISLGDGLTTVRTVELDPDLGPSALFAECGASLDRVVHRFPHAPAGVGEVSEALDPVALLVAGELESADSVSRVAALAFALEQRPDLPQLLVFDTPWFAALPEIARHYAIPPDAEARLGLRRVGRHGPVHRLASERCSGGKLVSIFLGYESSAAAVVNGRPVEISAGATGLEGLPGSRTVGDVDPAALLYMMENVGDDLEQVATAVGAEGGWGGLAGVRTLPDLRASATTEARDARLLLLDRCRRYIGAWAAVMDGLDGVVISGDADHVDHELIDELGAGLEYLGVPARVPLTLTDLTPALAAAIVTA
jgi:acetate kinase